jgi:hypothetical protein
MLELGVLRSTRELTVICAGTVDAPVAIDLETGNSVTRTLPGSTPTWHGSASLV